ncbi:MAG: LptF/LptG family permease, partial [Bacteroidia bacterium]|nr:LptF/LptG family permease [Bacteroidia bacterium]
VIFQLFFYTAVQLSLLSFPIAVLMASLTTLGRLGETYELAAIKASGISLFRVMRPLMIVTAAVTMVSFAFAWFFVPRANLKLYTLLYDIQQAKPELALKPGYFNGGIPNTMLFFSRRGPNGMLYDVKIWEHSQGTNNGTFIAADSARVVHDRTTLYLKLKLYGGEQHEAHGGRVSAQSPEPTFGRMSFDTLIFKLDVSGFGLKRSDEKWFRQHQYMLTLPEMFEAVDSIAQTPRLEAELMTQAHKPYLHLEERLKCDSASRLSTNASPGGRGDSLKMLVRSPVSRAQIYERALNRCRAFKAYVEGAERNYNARLEDHRKYLIELHLKFTLPLACVVLLFVGAPLGAIIRKGGLGTPTVVAVLFFVVFYVMMTHGRKLAREGVIDVAVGVWAPIWIMTPVALYLTYQSATDSKLFETASWRYLFDELRQKINNRFSRPKRRRDRSS